MQSSLLGNAADVGFLFLATWGLSGYWRFGHRVITT